MHLPVLPTLRLAVTPRAVLLVCNIEMFRRAVGITRPAPLARFALEVEEPRAALELAVIGAGAEIGGTYLDGMLMSLMRGNNPVHAI